MSEEHKTSEERSWWTKEYLYPNWYIMFALPTITSVSALVSYRVLRYLVFGE